MPLNSAGAVSDLERVILAAQSTCELVERGGHHVDAARIVHGERAASLHDVQRRTFARAGLGERENAALEIEERERDLRGCLAAFRRPLQPSRDHQVDDEKVVAVEAEHDALADPFDRSDRAPEQRIERRNRRAQDERALERDVA